MKVSRTVLTSLIILLLFNIVIFNTVTASPPAEEEFIKIDPEKVLEHVWKFSSFGPRITGYEGCLRAKDYIFSQIKDYFDKILVIPFSVTVPYEYGSSVTFKGSNLFLQVKAYALAPNLVETCYTAGATGEVVYVKSKYGDLRDFEGINVTNKIVVLDFNSKDAWRWAVYLGAKGAIFILDRNAKYLYVEDVIKRFWLPIDFPRVAVFREDIEPVLELLRRGETGVLATLKIDMKMEVRTAYNIIAIKEGSSEELKDEIIAAITYYDSWSIVPSLNPGEDDALSAAILIEVAKTLAARKPKRTLLVGFFAGHYQALAGVRDFIYRAIHNETLREILNKIRISVEISASAHDYKVGIYDQGHFHVSVTADTPVMYSNRFIQLRTGWDQGKPSEFPGVWNLAQRYTEIFLGKEVTSEVLYFDDYNPITSPLDYIRYFEFEGFTLIQILSFSVGTVSLSPCRFTPSDVIEGTEDQKRNISIIANIYVNILKYLTIDYDYKLPFEEHNYKETSIRTIVGRTVTYNLTKGAYQPLPDTCVVFIFFPRLLLQQPIGPYIRHYFVAKSDANGTFKIPLAVPSASYFVLAFKDEPSEGPVDYAIDFGEYGTVLGTVTISPQPETYVEISLFPAGSMVVFDVYDPETMSPTMEQAILIIDHVSQNFARFFGFQLESLAFIPHPNYMTGTVQLFVNPELANTLRFDVLFSLGGTRWYSLILTNRNEGYYIAPGQQFILCATVLRGVQNYDIVNRERFIGAKTGKLYTTVVEELLNAAYIHWNEAIECLSKGRYYEARGRALLSLAMQRQAYINLRLLIFDASYSSVFFLLLSIPFAFLLERLLFEFEDIRKRFATVGVVFAVVSLYMYFNHPGFALITNVPLVAMGFLMMILTIFPLIVTMSHAGEAIKEIRLKFVGKHFAEIDKLSAIFLSTSLGIRNLRRRRLRTSLVILSVAVSTMAFVSMITLFSATHVVVISHYTMDNGYEGILIRQTLPSRFLPSLLAEQLRSVYGSDLITVLPFYVYYPVGERVPIRINITTHEIIGPIALVGLNPEDFKYLPGLSNDKLLSEMIEKGPGPLFRTPDDLVCIVPEELMKTLGLQLGDEINILGLKLKIVGVLRAGAEKIYLNYVKDLDNFPVISLAREIEPGGRVTVRALNPAPPSEVIFLPSGLVRKLGGGVFGIRLIYKDPKRGERIARELAGLFNYFVYYSYKGPDGKYYVKQYASVSTQQVMGQEAIMPAIILLSTILSSILGAVHERRREIGILSSIGLSPLHVAGVFLMEFVIVAIISSFIGYAVGITLPNAINVFLPPAERLSINAGSLWVVLAVSLSILVTLAATAYPIRFASRLVTPSLERKWRLEAQSIRRGDTFIINLPFVIKREEIDGALEYLREYLSLYRGEEGPFMIEKLGYHEKTVPEGRLKTIDMRIRVKPFDWDVVMTSQLQVHITKKTSTWTLIVTRLSGTEHIWLRGVRKLTDVIRKQLLMWRSLKPSEREEYIERAGKRTSEKSS